MSQLECYICGVEGAASGSDLPEDWGRRSINSDPVVVCDCCNDSGNWIGGISPALKVEVEDKRGIEVYEAE